MRGRFVVAGAFAVIAGSGCGRSEAPVQTAKVTAVTPAAAPAAPAAPVAPPAPLVRASTDFRLAQLDPSVIGTTATCDVGRVEVLDRAPGVLVHCGVDHRDSRIGLTVPREVVPALTARTQIEVRIDGPGERGTDAEALTTFVKVNGEWPPPEPPSRCLCDRDRELAFEAERPKRPDGWEFTKFSADRKRYWGTTQICVLGSVHEVARSSTEARDYSVGRVFDPEQLRFAADVWCRSASGASVEVIVGSDSPYLLLGLAEGQAIAIELGWASHFAPTGRVTGVVYRPL